MDRIRNRPLLILPLMLSAFLLGVQLWLFMWAPLNGKALDVSLGYLLMPLVMVVCGRFVYKEQLQPFQKVAVLFAVVGVGKQLVQVGGLSWEVLVVALGFPAYFVLRRKLRTDHLGGLWGDMAFMIPVALWVIVSAGFSWEKLVEFPRLFLQIPLLGLISASATACFIIASRLLPLSLFGLLSYAEPVLLVMVSLILGESIREGEGLTYAGVGLAIAILALGGAKHVHAARGVQRDQNTV